MQRYLHTKRGSSMIFQGTKFARISAGTRCESNVSLRCRGQGSLFYRRSRLLATKEFFPETPEIIIGFRSSVLGAHRRALLAALNQDPAICVCTERRSVPDCTGLSLTEMSLSPKVAGIFSRPVFTRVHTRKSNAARSNSRHASVNSVN